MIMMIMAICHLIFKVHLRGFGDDHDNVDDNDYDDEDDNDNYYGDDFEDDENDNVDDT